MRNPVKKYFAGYNQPGGIKELLYLALPMIISTASDGVMTFTDRLFLARIGSEQMNAAMGGGVALQIVMFFFIGLTGYSTALVAQYYGANEKYNASKAAFQAILISIIAWPVIIITLPLTYSYFGMMKISPVQIEYQIQYMSILAWGSVFSLLRYTLGCYFTGIGKTKIVMFATIFALLVNVLLDYILIFGKFGLRPMGINGAAIATISGAASAVIILTIAYFRKSNLQEFGILQSFKLKWTIMKKLLYFGYPAGVEMFLNFLAFSAMVFLFHAKGDTVATATTIMFNWDLVSFIPLLGIEIAVTSLVGRYMGAGKPAIARHAAISGIKTGIFYSLIVLILFVFIPETLVRVFHPQDFSQVFEEAVPIAKTMIRIAALYVLVEAAFVALVGALRGAGDTHFTMFASVIAHWSFVPLLWVSLNILELSVEFSWFLLVLFFLIFCAVIYLRFKSGKWMNIHVIN